jgi:hypothetical protein
MNKLGAASVLSAGTNSVVTTAIKTQDPTWLTISNTVAIISIVGSLAWMVKIGVDIHFARRKDKREQEEHKLKMDRLQSENIEK